MKKLLVLCLLTMSATLFADIDDVYYWTEKTERIGRTDKHEVSNKQDASNMSNASYRSDNTNRTTTKTPKVYFEDVTTQHPDTVRVLIRR